MDEINNMNDTIKFLEKLMGVKLKWHQKLWLRFSTWADYKLRRAFTMR